MSLITRTVEAVNHVRRELGADPVPDLVPGCVGAEDDCPVARAVTLGLPDHYAAEVSGAEIVVFRIGRVVLRGTLPSEPQPNQAGGITYQSFVDLFDAGPGLPYKHYRLPDRDYRSEAREYPDVVA